MWRQVVLLAAALVLTARAQRRCYSDVDCPDHASCDTRVSGRCRCGSGFTSWLDGCLPTAGLREPCQVSPQCRALDEHAVCLPEKRTCGCRRGYRSMQGRCQFQFLVTEPTLEPEEDAELARMLGVSRAGRQHQREMHQQAFVRGLTVTGVLVGLTLVVFAGAWLVSRHVRQREQREQADALPQKYGAPPPYSVSQDGGTGGSFDDLAAAEAYSQTGPVA